MSYISRLRRLFTSTDRHFDGCFTRWRAHFTRPASTSVGRSVTFFSWRALFRLGGTPPRLRFLKWGGSRFLRRGFTPLFGQNRLFGPIWGFWAQMAIFLTPADPPSTTFGGSKTRSCIGAEDLLRGDPYEGSRAPCFACSCFEPVFWGLQKVSLFRARKTKGCRGILGGAPSNSPCWPQFGDLETFTSRPAC